MCPNTADQHDEDVEANPVVAERVGTGFGGPLAVDTRQLEQLRYSLVWLFLIGLPFAAICGVRPRAGGADEPNPVKFPPPATSRQVNDRPRRLPSPPLVEEAWFQAAQDQLRRQGAVYVRLEKWHSDPVVYCFSCRCGRPGEDMGPDGLGELSALSTSPQHAVQAVIRRLEAMASSPRPSSGPTVGGEIPSVATGVDDEPLVRIEERQADRSGRP